MKKSISLLVLLSLIFNGVIFSSCEKEEDLNIEISLAPGQLLSISSIFPKVSESKLTNFTSDNNSIVTIYKEKQIETLKPGKTKIHNGKCVANITVEPYKGVVPYTLPSGIIPFVSEKEVVQLMANYGNPTVGADFYRYTFCKVLTYRTSTESISYYFDEKGSYSDETRKLVFIVIEPTLATSAVLAYLLTNYTLTSVNESGSVVKGNREFQTPDNWTIDTPNMPNTQPWQYVRYIAPGY